MTESEPQRKKGMRDVILAIVAAALIMSPSYLSRIISHRTSADLSVLGVMSLGLFLVGVFLLVKVLGD